MATKMDNSVSVNDVSRISAGTLFKGEIQSPGDIRIDGSFDGKLVSRGRVVVGEKASLTGDVICQNMDFCGSMKGNFYVKDTLTLKSGCTVDGDLHIKRLQVELGARFNGNCKMIEDAEFEKLTGSHPGAGQPVQK
ncbi:MAG: polymer-forming cytoskeletal protein [Bacteroidales bacterium]|nr:polymer-forming cytoskeletal protein [Bacteroidales bacterium]